MVRNEMRVCVSDPSAAPYLGEFLRSRISAIVEPKAAGELEVSLLGSFNNDSMMRQLSSAVREWEALRHPGACTVEIANSR